MSKLRRVVRSILPESVYGLLRDRYREFVFARAMRKFMENPNACTLSDSPVLMDLVTGWGNEWSAMPEYLAGCIGRALISKGPMLECGSGLSTVLIGFIAQSRGYTLWTLEHEPAWGNKVQGYLDKYKIDSVRMCIRPLKEYPDFSWYDPPIDSMPNNFETVICDGPPGGTRGGRYGLVPVMKGRFASACTILIDDAAREQEQAICRRWESELRASTKSIGVHKPYIEMTIA